MSECECVRAGNGEIASYNARCPIKAHRRTAARIRRARGDYYGGDGHPRRSPRELAEDHPAETGSAGVGLLIAAVALVFHVDLDPQETAAAVAGVGAVAAVVTKIVHRYRRS